MNPPIPPRASGSIPPENPLDPRLITWTELHKELSELHARLEYYRLLLNLSARRLSGS